MDAQAHLLSLGWAGPGHSLDSRPYQQKGHRGLAYDPAKVGNTGQGLVKPLLVAQRRARLGVGKKAHEPSAGNEWWLKGFESALDNIGKSESERSSGTATPIANDQVQPGKHGGLYSFFVKGQALEGTLTDVEQQARTAKKRKTDVLEPSRELETAPKRTKQQTAAAEFAQVGAYIALRDRDMVRRQRKQKPNPVDEFRQVGAYLEARSEKKSKRRKSTQNQGSTGDVAAGVDEARGSATTEPSQERRQRRRAEKNRSSTVTLAQSLHSPPTGDQAAAEKAARRLERRRRKAEKAARLAQTG